MRARELVFLLSALAAATLLVRPLRARLRGLISDANSVQATLSLSSRVGLPAADGGGGSGGGRAAKGGLRAADASASDELAAWGGALTLAEGRCPAGREHTEYDGDVVRWGAGACARNRVAVGVTRVRVRVRCADGAGAAATRRPPDGRRGRVLRLVRRHAGLQRVGVLRRAERVQRRREAAQGVLAQARRQARQAHRGGACYGCWAPRGSSQAAWGD
jgi:hypothetical protein